MKSNWIYFDLDGTLNRFYEIEGWLEMLINNDPTPYKIAAPLVNMNKLARTLNKLQKRGYKIGIISWLSKSSTPEYDEAVTAAKLWWLKKHLNSVQWDEINIVAYGRNKWEMCKKGILFDDELNNRLTWGEKAYEPSEIFDILKTLDR